MTAAVVGIALITGVIAFSSQTQDQAGTTSAEHVHQESRSTLPENAESVTPINNQNGKTFDVSGIANFEGNPPLSKKLNLPSGCAKPGQGDSYSNEVLVKNGKLQNVLIRVVKGAEGMKFPDIPKEEVELDQRGCMYTPRVTAARIGQKVTFINSDPVFHNVRSVTTENQRFNMAMPKKDQRETKIFDKPEVFLQTKCSVHPWMGAYVAIMEHPFYSVSNEQGEFKLPKLPVGKYTIEAWHEIFGTQKQEIEILETGAPTVTFNFKAGTP